MSKALMILFFFGRPFGPLYSALMKSRESLYISGVFRGYAVDVPIISIGNLVLGGTGKTPTVQHLAKLLLNHGYRPAIVSRGHGGKAGGKVNIVSDGKNIFLSTTEAGDEPKMLAESLPGVPVLTGKRRILPCRLAIEQFNANVLILDDGFQHLSVKRDLDIVLFDGTTLAGNSRVFPAGPLREPVSALNRCQAFLLTGTTTSNKERTDKFSKLLQQRFPDKPVFFSTLDDYQLVDIEGEVKKLEDSKRYYAFCGIANPERFEKSLVNLGVNLSSFQALKDHSPYSQTLVSTICKNAVQSGAEGLITTEKDLVKLRDFTLQLPLYFLKTHQNIDQDFDRFVLKFIIETHT